MTKRTIVDCNPTTSEFGRTRPPTILVRDLTQAEQADYDALQLIPPPIDTVTSCSGRVTLAVSDGQTKTVRFSKSMHSADYVVTLQPSADLGSVRVWASSLAMAGFTLNLSVAVSGVIGYIAQEVT